MDKTEGFQCLGPSNWTICSTLSPFCSEKFPIFSLSYWGAHSYYPRGPIMRKGNSHNFQYGSDRGVSVPGVFKLDHLQPLEPILFPKIFNFFTFILGSPFLLPQRDNYEKGKLFQLQIWMRKRAAPLPSPLDLCALFCCMSSPASLSSFPGIASFRMEAGQNASNATLSAFTSEGGVELAPRPSWEVRVGLGCVFGKRSQDSNRK